MLLVINSKLSDTVLAFILQCCNARRDEATPLLWPGRSC